KGPCPWTSILVTGGAKPEYDNLTEWFSAGAACVGMGSKLVTKEIIANQDFDLLTQNVKNALEIIGKVKQGVR
ncbi:MAG: bifunctional 4-hydroxy-2-oxoglutarate aldolase/2-dehydro-3-deoxy-phosphogluconate aldolase, partial [Bacteroidales bacterium]|nr:bifunctional 4-hydroxy-2-oxoglutarate aldolase/2-dehydro-3-deoxy-phosphogluconate aldolase [Bacteroidales bacterium]